MALYEYRCRTCDDRFEVRRPMAEAGDPASCPSGHADTVRLLSTFGMVSVGGAASTASTASAFSGGGCCGGGCGCH